MENIKICVEYGREKWIEEQLCNRKYWQLKLYSRLPLYFTAGLPMMDAASFLKPVRKTKFQTEEYRSWSSRNLVWGSLGYFYTARPNNHWYVIYLSQYCLLMLPLLSFLHYPCFSSLFYYNFYTITGYSGIPCHNLRLILLAFS